MPQPPREPAQSHHSSEKATEKALARRRRAPKRYFLISFEERLRCASRKQYGAFQALARSCLLKNCLGVSIKRCIDRRRRPPFWLPHHVFSVALALAALGRSAPLASLQRRFMFRGVSHQPMSVCRLLRRLRRSCNFIALLGVELSLPAITAARRWTSCYWAERFAVC